MRTSPPSSPAIAASSRSASSRRAIAASACSTRTRPASVGTGALARALEQLHPDLALERRDLLTDGRLREEERRRPRPRTSHCVATSRRMRNRFTSSIRTPYQTAWNFLLRLFRRRAILNTSRTTARGRSRAGGLKMTHETEIQKMSGVTIRRLGVLDEPDVAHLAQLDSKPVPRGDLLGAEIEGRLVAVAPIDGGETIADPFSRTSELRALLELRAVQLRGRGPRRSRLGNLSRRRTPVGRPGAPAPPGAGGRLLSQPLRPCLAALERRHREAGLLELLPVELGRLALARPDDRLAARVDLVGEAIAGVQRDARGSPGPASAPRGRTCCGRR